MRRTATGAERCEASDCGSRSEVQTDRAGLSLLLKIAKAEAEAVRKLPEEAFH